MNPEMSIENPGAFREDNTGTTKLRAGMEPQRGEAFRPIRNLLFDMGGCLIRWDPALFVGRLDLSQEDRDLLRREVFEEVEWVRLDRGNLSEEDALTSICRRLPPRLHDGAERLVYHWNEPPLSVDGMDDLARDASQAGYRLFLLSNAGPRHGQYWPTYPASRFFGDRLFISSTWKVMKPDPAFFETALSHFGLDRRECLFLDDNPINVEAAVHIGLRGVVFHGDAAELRRKLRDHGVILP